MVCSHAAVFDTTERQIRTCYMHNGIIDTASPERSLIEDHFLLFPALGEKVKSKRFWPGVDEGDGFIQSVILKNR